MKSRRTAQSLSILSTLGTALIVAMIGAIPFAQTGRAADSPHVVYGSDDRQDVSDVTNPLYKKLAQSSAAMIPGSSLTAIPGTSRLKVTAATLQVDQNLCPGERFASQSTAAYCSGFLVGSDILVTAGHCVEDSYDCSKFRWVFDYQQDKLGNPISVESSNVYSCASIISREQNPETQNDFAVIRLDRAVTGRDALQVRKTGKITLGTDLIVIGNPSGIPTKVAGGGKVRRNDDPSFFTANLDTFAGNSGSAVFDAKTGVVEGILVRGEDDYVDDATRGCSKVNVCTNDGCRGEDVTRITGLTIPRPSPSPSASPAPSPSPSASASPSPKPSASPSATPSPSPSPAPSPSPSATPTPVISDAELEMRSNAIFQAIFAEKTAPEMKLGLFGKNLGYESGRFKIAGAALLGCRVLLEKDNVVIASHSGSCKKPEPFMEIIRYYILQTL